MNGNSYSLRAYCTECNRDIFVASTEEFLRLGSRLGREVAIFCLQSAHGLPPAHYLWPSDESLFTATGKATRVSMAMGAGSLLSYLQNLPALPVIASEDGKHADFENARRSL